ncbi:MAG: nucleotidyltransferase family protein [Pyrinomonadaceae bacterium]
MFPLTQEQELLLLLSSIDPDREKLARLLARDVDWETLYSLADQHRVLPQCFEAFSLLPESVVPSLELAKFRKRASDVAKSNLARAGQLIKLLDIFQGERIDIIVYKGLPLASSCYGDAAKRQFTDIDLLIRKADFPTVKKILLELGARPAHEFNANEERAVLKHSYEFPFFYGETDTLIEVHWDFVESFFAFNLDSEEVWSRAKNIELYGKKVLTLGAEDNLVVIAAHSAKHFWQRLGWVCDIDRLVRTAEIDWNLVASVAKASGALKMVRMALLISRRLLNTPVCESLETFLNNSETEETIALEIAGSYLFGPEPVDWKEMARVHMTMKDSIANKFSYVYRLLKVKAIDKLFMPMGRPQ